MGGYDVIVQGTSVRVRVMGWSSTTPWRVVYKRHAVRFWQGVVFVVLFLNVALCPTNTLVQDFKGLL